MKFDVSTVKSAVEFGYRGCEKGYNIQKVLHDFDKFMETKG